MDAKLINDKNGYVLNKETGKLEYYVFKSATFTFDRDDEPLYQCTLGGKATTLKGYFKVYAEENDFVTDTPYQPTYVYFGRCGLCDNSKPAYIFKNGDAVEIPKFNILFTWDGKKLKSEKRLYDNRNEVLFDNDIVVVDEYGNETIKQSYKTKTTLTEEQMELLSQLKDLLSTIEKSDIELFFNRTTFDLNAFNKRNVTIINRWADYDENKCNVFDLDSLYTVCDIADAQNDDYSFHIE